MVEHIYHVGTVVDKHLDNVPNSCLRFRENQTLNLLLTLRGDARWHYWVNELHPKVWAFRDWMRYY